VAARDVTGASPPSPPVSAVGRPGAPAVSITSYSTTGLVVNWKDVSGDIGYRIERSTDGGATFNTIGTLGVNVPAINDAGLALGTSYTYRVTALSAAGDSTPSTTVAGGTRLNAVAGIGFDAIASTAGRGASGYSSGTFTLISSGSDIGGTSDGFRYTSQPLVGDGQIVARIAAIDNNDANAKSGVMIRAGTAANAQFAAVVVT